MKAIIQDIKEMTDSRELLESKPNPVIPIFVYTLIAMILAALLWSYFGEIDENIKAQGVVRPDDKISSIKNIVAGKVENVNIKEGKKVKSGDILYTIEHTSLDLEKSSVSKELEKDRLELVNSKKLKQSILDDKNYFDQNNENERDYYDKYVKYQTDIKVNQEQGNNSNLDLKQMKSDTQNSQSSTQTKVDEMKDTLQSLQLLKQSIDVGKNLIKESDSEYYNKYIDYTLSVEKLTSIVEQSKEVYDTSVKLGDVGTVSKKELEDAQSALENAKLDLEKYQNEYVMNIHDSIEQDTQTLNDLETNLEKTHQSLAISGGKEQSTDIMLLKYKMDTLVQLDEDISAYEDNIDKSEKDLETVNLNLQDSIVVSPIDGVVNIVTDINKGDLLQSDEEVATIVPENNSQYKVQIYVSNSDIANLEVGEKIKYHFSALPYKEYGELEGTIVNIGTDATVDQEKGTSFYIVEAAIENRPLYSYKGVKAEIKVGMTCEAQVITKSKKILYYILEELNLKD